MQKNWPQSLYSPLSQAIVAAYEKLIQLIDLVPDQQFREDFYGLNIGVNGY